MLYKPNFCCNCGEKVERAEWNLLTSRRFCEACSIENRRHDILPRVSVAAGALALMFGFGTFFGSRTEGNIPVQNLSASPAQFKVEPSAGKQPISSIPAAAADGVPGASAAVTTKVGPAANQAAPAKVYYCGALTKKGTPCSRKVKSAGARCYQHEGKASAEPEG